MKLAKQKKDRSHKRYVPRDRKQVKLRHDPWRLKSVFDPLTKVLDQLDNDGTLTVMGEDEQIVFKDLGNGKWYDMPAALNGFIELFELYEVRYKVTLPLEPLRQLHAKIIAGQDIGLDDTSAARASSAALHTACLDMTILEAEELTHDYLLKEALNGNIIEL